MRYVTNGETMLITDNTIPPGCWEISKEEYDAAAEARQAARDEYEREYHARRNAIRASAKAKLLAGEPLTEQEADLLLG